MIYKLGTRTMLVLQWFSQPKLAFNIPVLYYADNIYSIKNANNK